MAGRQLPDPRHALQHRRRCCKLHARRGRRRDRRPDAGAHGRDRRARAAVRRRHLHARRLRVARHRRQPRRRSASTTKARTSGRSATRSGAAWSRSSRARSRYSIIDAKAVGRFMPPVFPGTRARARCRSSRARSSSTRRASCRRCDAFNAACRAGHVRPHGARRLRAPTGSRRPRRTGRGRSTRRRSSAMRCGRASRSPTSASRSTRRAAVHFGGAPSPNLFVAGEMMAGNMLGQGYTAGVGMTIGTAFGRIAGQRRGARRAREESSVQQLERCMPMRAPDRRRSRGRRGMLQICNACRYCEGFCAVFPAMTRRLEFDQRRRPLPRQPVPQLRRLPARVPVRAAARVRRQRAAARWRGCARETYVEYAWPRALRRALRAQRPDARAGAGGGPGAVSRARRWRAPAPLFGRPLARQLLRGLSARPDGRGCSAPCSLFACVALGDRRRRASGATLGRAGASGAGVARGDRTTRSTLQLPRRRPRRRLQRRGRRVHAARAGASTTSRSTASCSASPRPASRRSTTTRSAGRRPIRCSACRCCSARVGGIGAARRHRRAALAEPAPPPAAPRPGADARWTAASSPCCSSTSAHRARAARAGATRGAMALLLAIHLGVVMALFLTLPYGKFAHGVYRCAALLKWAIEKRRRPA